MAAETSVASPSSASSSTAVAESDDDMPPPPPTEDPESERVVYEYQSDAEVSLPPSPEPGQRSL